MVDGQVVADYGENLVKARAALKRMESAILNGNWRVAEDNAELAISATIKCRTWIDGEQRR